MTDEEKKQHEAELQKAKDDAAVAARKEEQDKIKADIESKNKEIEDLRSKDLNFAKVRDQVVQKEKEIDDLKKKVTDIETRQVDTPKKRMIDALAGNNPDLKKKMEEAYGSFSGEARTDEEIEDRVKKAYTIAKGEAPKPTDVSRMNYGGGGNNRVAPVNSDGQVNPDLTKAAEAFNEHLPKDKKITPEDLKNPKYKVKPGQSAESN